jgi:alpha-tubulin suppressor-like RCC1 family protein
MGIGRSAAARRTALTVVVMLAAGPLGVLGQAAAADVAPGTPYTWGSNSFGQLGNGTTSSTPTGPVAVSGLDDVVDVHGGREHVAALTSTGGVYTWGSNGEGQLGLGDSLNRSRPTLVDVPCGAGGVAAVATGHNSTLALCAGGTVWAWGLNADGQLGDGTRTLRRSPVQVNGLTDAVAIAAGRDMSYAVKADGTAWAWGDNQYGELGDGSTTDRVSPVRVGSLTDVVGIAGGRNHGLVVRSDGSVYAFGWNAYGQLGDGTLTNRPVPALVSGLSAGVSEVAAGAHHSYALRSDGQVMAWGRNYRDELGDGTSTTRTRPVPVLDGSTPLSDVVSVGAGRDHGVAVLADGSVRAWGYNAGGQLGDGTTTDRSRAVTVAGVSGATQAGGGGNEYSVVLAGPGSLANREPVARITVSCAGLDCTFGGATSSDPDGSVTGYAWDLGDGGSSAAATVAHRYSSAGSYRATLTVTDDDGASGHASVDVVVSDAPPPTVTLHGVTTYLGTANRPSVAVPVQAVPGDQLLLFLTTARTATATVPAGWTLRGTVTDGTDLRSWVFSRLGVAAGGSVQVTLDASSRTSATLFAYAGAGSPTAVAASESGTTAAHRSPSAGVPVAGSQVVGYWADKTSTVHGWTLPSVLAARGSTTGTGTGMLTSVSGDAAGVAAGTWPVTTATAGVSSAKAVAWTVVLPPAASAGSAG